eukprot:gene16312-biopygen21785
MHWTLGLAAAVRPHKMVIWQPQTPVFRSPAASPGTWDCQISPGARFTFRMEETNIGSKAAPKANAQGPGLAGAVRT